MYRISEITLPLDGGEAALRQAAAKRLGVEESALREFSLVKRSVDARKKQDVHFICTVECDAAGATPSDAKTAAVEPYRYDIPCRKTPLAQRPVVVGLGPAGLFAALLLAQAGQRPLVFERGADVEQRTRDVEAFWSTGNLNPSSNVQFGEGGAGAFSDGKLSTGTKDTRGRRVFEELAAHGAPAEIMYDAKPHIGTDKLPGVVKSLREEIIRLGGEVRFNAALTALVVKNGVLAGAVIGGERVEADRLILAVGHSARDTLELLLESGVPLEQKPFSVGARIEHLQGMVNVAQYGAFAKHPALGAADYRMSAQLTNGRGVYTFCMCPGGTVVAAASEEGRVVTNGMSSWARDADNANAGLLVGVGPADFGSEHVLAGMALQRKLEEAAFRLGGGGYRAPAQRLEDFLKRRPSKSFGDVKPSYRPGVTPASLDACLPGFVADAMRQGIWQMNNRLRGFSAPDAVLTGVETRSSSPVRVTRGENLQSVGLPGLYPCGEGAGYAGGIVSAAVDGLKCAEMVLLS